MTNYEKIKAMSVEEMAEFLMATGFNTLSLFMKKCGFEGLPTELFNEVRKKNKQDWITTLKSEVEENMLPEICSCGYRFEADETICPNCGKKVEEDD